MYVFHLIHTFRRLHARQVLALRGFGCGSFIGCPGCPGRLPANSGCELQERSSPMFGGKVDHKDNGGYDCSFYPCIVAPFVFVMLEFVQ